MIIEPLLDIPRIYTAIAEWAFCLLYILYAKKRIKGFKLIMVIIGFLGLMVVHHHFASMLPIAFWIPGMIFAVLLMLLFIYSTADVNFYTAGYMVIQAFVLAEFAASLYWQIYYFVYWSFNLRFILLSEILLVLFYGGVFLIVYVVEKRYRDKGLFTFVKQNDLLTYVGIATIIFTISNMSFISTNTPLSGRYPPEIFYIRTLVDFAGIIILYSQKEHKLVVNSNIEINQMENLLYKQYAQYAMSQESIDLINRKYHDLKNQISIIRLEKNEEKKERYLEELESDIKWYEAQYKTGNHVLDTLLTAKTMTCIEKNINLTCIANGELLGFISTMDLCSIFGNALDNAIESVMNIEDTEKRLIKIAIYSKNKLLLIRFENYYVNPLSFRDGNLLTTKREKGLHGYGLLSIKNIVGKYCGSVSINTKNSWFRLVILIPIPDSDK
ncbi:MAG: ATP-binding protein [Candidatus Izemoplasmatales bacterium]|jgi:hypothetical protein|nr:ATP-binding protein [Candidatus Izemoplasmatales bacterium]